MSPFIPAKVARRFAAAEGYLELGMTSHALEELNSIDDIGDWEASRSFLRGLVFKADKRFNDAVDSFHQAAELLPEAKREFAWREISECFHEAGYDNLAAVAKKTADVVHARHDSVSQRSTPPENLVRMLHRSVTHLVQQAISKGLIVPEGLTVTVTIAPHSAHNGEDERV